MAEDVPLGRLYAELYEERAKPKEDDARARYRLLKLTSNILGEGLYDLSEHVEAEMGIKFRWHGNSRNWEQFLSESPILDLLHFITYAFRYLAARDRQRDYHGARRASVWLDGVARIFQEQNLGYRIDQAGGVHPVIDQAYQVEAAATISSLSGDRYKNADAELAKGLREFDSVPPDGKQAIRGVFAASEALFKLTFPDAPRLTAEYVKKLLIPALRRTGDRAVDEATKGVATSLAAWVDAAHWYRHEQGYEEPHQPPIALAVALVSQGLSHIRWLVEVDRQVNPKE